MLSSRCRRCAVLFLAASFSLAALVFAQGQGYASFADPERRFSIEYPRDWNWLVVAGSGEAVVVFTEPKKEAAFIVQVSRLRQPLEPGDMTDLFAQIEVEVLKADRPQATDLATRVADEGGKRYVIVDYSRPRLTLPAAAKTATGDRERVRQYSYPSGRKLYRVTCIAGPSRFSKYEAVFTSVFKSLTAAATQPPSAE
jgi:hypothetical protein